MRVSQLQFSKYTYSWLLLVATRAGKSLKKEHQQHKDGYSNEDADEAHITAALFALFDMLLQLGATPDTRVLPDQAIAIGV